MWRLTLVVSLVFYLALPKDAIGQRVELDNHQKLRQEIQLLNLLKGLYLSDEQMRFLIDKAQRAQQIKEDFIKEQQNYAEASTETLEQLKTEVAEEKAEVSQDIAREVHQGSHKMLKLRADYLKQMEQLVAEVKSNLSSTQQYIIEEFQPCLVPPKGPARFGQSGNSEFGVQRLERIRAMPAQLYAIKKSEIADRMLERALLHQPRAGEINEEELRAKILSTLDQARGLAEIEFNLQKEELVQQLKAEISPQKDQKVDIDRRIEHFLLNPTIIPLLEERLSTASTH